MSAPFTGVGVALVTLFDDDLAVDVAATADHARRLVTAGIGAIVVAGSTGEAASLTLDERGALLDAIRPITPVLVAGTGAPSAGQAVELTRHAIDHGADAVLALSPPATGDPRRYYDRVAAVAGPTPVLAYHYPVMSQPGIAVDVLPDLPVAGVKDSSGDPERLMATLHVWDRPTYTGSSVILSFAGAMGAAGAILALANVEPAGCIAAFACDADAQRSLWEPHDAARSIGGLKDLLAKRAGTSPARRMG